MSFQGLSVLKAVHLVVFLCCPIDKCIWAILATNILYWVTFKKDRVEPKARFDLISASYVNCQKAACQSIFQRKSSYHTMMRLIRKWLVTFRMLFSNLSLFPWSLHLSLIVISTYIVYVFVDALLVHKRFILLFYLCDSRGAGVKK